MLFFPNEVSVPEGLTTGEMFLRPLRTAHVGLDYEALMASNEMLQMWSQSSWPSADFTLEENWKDLDRHEQEHLKREAFTYTVLNSTGDQCLGCVYIQPLSDELQNAQSVRDAVGGEGCAAFVRFWVRESRLVDDLDRQLIEALFTWFEKAWPFAVVLFRTARGNSRQVKLFESLGLLLRHEASDADSPAAWLFYS
jgi:hypothetical protein